ncbi:grasp-with-spasm system ATP-grasp peptide maturase [Chryseobacterium aureum]|uniref:grasp-with-spasm system ATP-grasp peptide maturase n=1 Tax=Chryseobacterium aureum TaxID=2497456 RepID=UPI000F88D71A|nr:grasp-with-spasm system ATP-grasp peptide maturase [Chryseobacterium aureum]
MILIISDEYDISTAYVIDWLNYFQVEWLRINDSDDCELTVIDSKTFITLKQGTIDIDKVEAVWYRRGFIAVGEFRKLGVPQFNSYLSHNKSVLHEYLQYKLSGKRQINTFSKANVNKLIVNDIAKEIGLKIPEFYIDNKLHEQKKYKKTITKPITPGFLGSIDEFKIDSYTKILDKDRVKSFSTSLLQEYIEKKFEIRTFYLLGKCWSMAIFSQSDNQTQVDFRRYNKEVPNRTVPFKLPESIEKKIDNLMKRISLESGSIDFLYSADHTFYFLEVNPVGQFDMVSFPCNYHLEKEIALHLINRYETEE